MFNTSGQAGKFPFAVVENKPTAAGVVFSRYSFKFCSYGWAVKVSYDKIVIRVSVRSRMI